MVSPVRFTASVTVNTGFKVFCNTCDLLSCSRRSSCQLLVQKNYYESCCFSLCVFYHVIFVPAEKRKKKKVN